MLYGPFFLPRLVSCPEPWQELVGVLGLELRFETTTVPQKKRRVTGMGQIIEAPGITDWKISVPSGYVNIAIENGHL